MDYIFLIIQHDAFAVFFRLSDVRLFLLLGIIDLHFIAIIYDPFSDNSASKATALASSHVQCKSIGSK